MFKIAIVAGSLALSSAALARPDRLNDAQYIAMARCQALMTSTALGREDTRGIDAMLKSQAAGRSEAVFVRAEEVRFDAAQAARHSGVYGKAALAAERDGACRAFGGGAMATAAAAPGAARAN
jgi:hypothetical protein